MFWHLLITPLTAFLTVLFNALPPWTITIGSGYLDGAQGDPYSVDHSFLHYALLFLAPMDRFVPLHDGVLPLLILSLAIFTGLSAFKALKFILSLVPTISAGG